MIDPINTIPTDPASLTDEQHTAELAASRLREFAKRCDRVFALLILLQWVGAVAATLWMSPRSWDGLTSQIHPHVYAAVVLGGIVSCFPVYMALRFPGRSATRYVIAIAQMSWSALLIHISGGRIETHFHVFGSLAFLAWYRDWRVLLTAIAITAGDHAVRGWFAPEMIYGVSSANVWRTVEHALWVLFEGGFLFFAMHRSLSEVHDNARMHAVLERSYLRVEDEVRRQTADLHRAEARARAGEAFLNRVGDVAGVGGWQIDLATGALTWTEQTYRIHEVDPGFQPTIERAIAFYAPQARPVMEAAVRAGMEHGTPWDLELPLVTAKGKSLFVRAVGHAESEGGRLVRLVGAFQDVTHRKQAELEIRKLSVVVEQTPASVVITDTGGHIEYVNGAFATATGYTVAEVIGKNCRILKSGLMPADIYVTMWRELLAGREWRGELQNRRKNGDLFWELAVISPLKDASGATSQYMAVKEDITVRKAMEDELRSAARTDKLTGLPNRALFCERLQRAVVRGRQMPGYHFAVLFLDFDRFKNINDSLGHDVGDLLLQEIARRLRSTVRSGESLSGDAREHVTARLGGDEFVVLLDGIAGPNDAKQVATQLLEAFVQPYRLGEHEVYSTASIGIVTDDGPCGGSADDVLRDADTAMYEAKITGKGQYVTFDVSMRNRVQNRADLENDLRKALDAGQLFLMYQPIVSLQEGHVESFEALLRWRHPDRGLISPGEFIPIAEDTGLILPIGEWVLREACGQFARWRQTMGAAAPRSISINLSRKQLLMPTLVGVLRQILEQTGIPPACLHLEVTESAVMQDVDAAARTLHAIKAIGVQLDMDDFGTGYSSLACLHQFPIDVLKIDRSFVANIARGRGFAALVSAVTQLARNLNVRVVAEGIETVEQAVALQSLDCEFGQGYLFSRPLTSDEIPTFRIAARGMPGLTAA